MPKKNSIRFLAIFKPIMANKKELDRVKKKVKKDTVSRIGIQMKKIRASQPPTPASKDPLNDADRKTISRGNYPQINQDNNLDNNQAHQVQPHNPMAEHQGHRNNQGSSRHQPCHQLQYQGRVRDKDQDRDRDRDRDKDRDKEKKERDRYRHGMERPTSDRDRWSMREGIKGE